MKTKNKKNDMTNEEINEKIDKILFAIAKKDYEPIPDNIHNNILKTISELEKQKETSLVRKPKKRFNFSFDFKRKLATLMSRPIKAFVFSVLSVMLVTTTAVGARNISDKFLGKDTVRLDNIGIANEFIFTDEMEQALKQNVPLNLIQLNEDYYIHIDSILVDEINFFTVFELHCKNGVTDDLRFSINDLKITDENNNILLNIDKEISNNAITGYNHIYNTENSIKELFFMFGNDNSKIKKLNFSFSDIEIYRHNTQLNTNTNFKNIHINDDKQIITVPITKDNYNTIQEYVCEYKNNKNQYNIEKAILTKTGLYITMATPDTDINPIIKIDNKSYNMLYNLHLDRLDINNYSILLTYNINNIPETIKLYNNLDKKTYNFVQKK